MNYLRIIRATIDAAENPNVGTAIALTEAVVDELLTIVPVETLRASLDARDRKAAELAADVAEDIKLAGG
jgi:hypothetical protein